MNDSKTLENIEKKLSAILAVLVLLGDEGLLKSKKVKLEVVLDKIGLESKDIATLLGKGLPAVQKTLQRAKK
ncbi:hypothetical protein IPJ70_01210 [Candidatus Campbellbacteria bacterium]|nr:MAG: hypothetical protein IPJ70_01210 [Candidatus Campbellbacteria bacterium]